MCKDCKKVEEMNERQKQLIKASEGIILEQKALIRSLLKRISFKALVFDDNTNLKQDLQLTNELGEYWELVCGQEWEGYNVDF